jgi:hypothetical protein
VQFAAGLERGGGEVLGTDALDAVFVVGHDDEEVITNREDGGTAVAGVAAASGHGVPQAFLAVGPGLVALAVELADLLPVDAGHQHDEGEGLRHSRLGMPEVEATACQGGEVAIAGAVDECLRGESPTAGLVLDDGVGDAPIHDLGADSTSVEADIDARVLAELFEEDLHFLHVERAGALALGVEGARATVLQFGDELGHDAGLVVEVEEVGQESRRPDAAETAMEFHQTRPRSGAGGGKGGADASGTGPADEDIVFGSNRDFASGFEDV